MKNKLFLFLLCLAPIAMFAQTNGFTPDAADEKVRDILGKYSLVKALLIPLTTVLVMFSRKWIGLIPDQAWPIVAPFIGAGLDWVGARFGFWTGSAEAGLAVGGLAVWFSQLGKQSKELMVDGPSVTKSGDTNEINKPPPTSNPS